MSAIPTTPARRRPTTWLALALLALALGMVGFMFAVAIFAGPGEGRPRDSTELVAGLGAALAGLASPVVGAALAIVRPHNAVGWLLLLVGLGFASSFFVPLYVDLAISHDLALPGYRVLDWVTPAFNNVGYVVLVVWLPLLFPDGRLPGPRWRGVAAVIFLAMVISTAVTLLSDSADEARQLPNPVALSGPASDLVTGLADLIGFVSLAFIALAVVAVLVRFRRSRGVERQQMKWFLAAAVLMGATALLAAVTWSTWVFVLFMAALAFLPIAIGVAVLRYRLYEIDRLISRTIGWATVTIVLVGAFSLLVLGSSAVLEPLTGGNTLAVAGSTLIVAALFTPLRSRVQRAVDRRFDRARYDGERLVGAFGLRVRDEVDLETIRADVLATVDQAVRPASVGLWLRERAEGGR